MTTEVEIQKFYSKIKFPGTYTVLDLEYYNSYKNPFLKPYVDAAKVAINVLDVGCGTGYITNLLALRNKFCTIDAIDFSDSIDYALKFSKDNNITNVNYYKTNFFNFNFTKKYDLIISNGVLHHIPNYKLAIEILNELNPEEMVLGVYNKYGKLAKKFMQVNYWNELLRKDQEECPYETAFGHNEFCNFFPNYDTYNVYPKSNLHNLFNYKNGGLTIYHFVRNWVN